MKTLNSIPALVAATLALTTGVAQAASGDWLIRAGVHNVDPKSNNHPVVKADDAPSLTISGSYFLTDNVAVEVLGAYPFTHDVLLKSDGSNSFGLTAEVGMDIALNDDWAVNLNARWFDIDSDARLDGADLGTVEVDPLVYGIMLTRKLRL